MLDVLYIYQSHAKPALLKVAGNEGEDGNHANNTIFTRRKKTCQKDADNQVEELHAAATQHTPKEALGCFLF